MAVAAFLPVWSNVSKPVIGMVHLPALPGAPRYAGDLTKLRDAVSRDVDALAEGGVHGLMVENFGDVPFYPGRVPAYVVAQMTAIAADIRRRCPNLPLGINVLRNDGQSALAVAHAVGAAFIRVNVLCGGRVADQGLLQAIAHDLLRERAMLGADVKILADVDVKHSAPLAPRNISDEVEDVIRRGLADGLVVSGSGTGKTTDPDKVVDMKSFSGTTPLFVGSGVTATSLRQYMNYADGFIVGTAFKKNNNPNEPVEVSRVKELIARL